MTLPTQTQALRNGWLDALALDFAFYSQPATSAFSQQFRIGICENIFFYFSTDWSCTTREFPYDPSGYLRWSFYTISTN